MATHNGERFLAEQLESILPQLGSDDEVIIVDDLSADRTREILSTFADSRLRVYWNQQNVGAEQTFDRAMRLATKQIIFMADQDDVWLPGRVQLMAKALETSGAMLVSSNSEYIDAQGKPVAFPSHRVRAADSRHHARHISDVFIGKAPYYGCAMAFSRDIVPLICPIPAYVESHDLWIALAANLIRSNIHLEEQTLQRRIHGNNASVVRRSIARMAWSRIIFVRSVLDLSARYLGSFRNRRTG